MPSKIKENRKITWVELIVLLMILAILAALTISSFSDFVNGAKNKSRMEETESVAGVAATEVLKAYKVGKTVDEINGGGQAAKNLRIKVLGNAGVSGSIVSIHVSDGNNEKTGAVTPAPNSLNFMPAGTLEFLEYRSSNGWYGQYRILADGTSEVRIVDSSTTENGVNTGD